MSHSHCVELPSPNLLHLLEDPLFRQFLDALNIGISIIAQDGTILFFNKSECSIFGIDEGKKYEGQKLDVLFSTTKVGVFKAINTKKSNTHPTISNDGVEGISIRTPITDEHGNVVCCVVETITTTLEKKRIDELLQTVQVLKQKAEYYDKKNVPSVGIMYTFDSLIGESVAMLNMKERGRRFARKADPVSIFGESGTGKELIAQALHMASPRVAKPFISVNCAALPPNLVDSELFGYAEGAFTGSKQGGMKGKFELANQGTIFLDEISELSLPVQAKLLRVLESHEIQKIGSATPVYADFRLITATNQNLLQLVRANAFREDLFHRLNTLELILPPLREREGDLPLLVEHVLHQIGGRQRAETITLAPRVWALFLRYPWSGNVRELKNVLTFALCCMEESEQVLDVNHLPARFLQNLNVTIDTTRPGQAPSSLGEASAHAEKQLLIAALQRAGHNKSRAARELGISRNTLYNKLHQLGLY